MPRTIWNSQKSNNSMDQQPWRIFYSAIFFNIILCVCSIEYFSTPFLPGSRIFELFRIIFEGEGGCLDRKVASSVAARFWKSSAKQKLACITSIRMFSFHKIARIAWNIFGIVWSKLLFCEKTVIEGTRWLSFQFIRIRKKN